MTNFKLSNALKGNKNAAGKRRMTAAVVGGLTGGVGAAIHNTVRAAKGKKVSLSGHALGAGATMGAITGSVAGVVTAARKKRGYNVSPGKAALKAAARGSGKAALTAGIGSAVGLGVGRVINKIGKD